MRYWIKRRCSFARFSFADDVELEYDRRSKDVSVYDAALIVSRWRLCKRAKDESASERVSLIFSCKSQSGSVCLRKFD